MPNIKGLSREEKIARLAAIQEKKRRIRKARPSLTPHPAQLKVIRSPALERYLFCGNGFGKTALLVNEIHWAATGHNPITGAHTPVPAIIYLVIDDPGKMEQLIIPEYKKWFELDDNQLHKGGKAYVSRISYSNGSVVYILTHEVNMLKIEGVEMTHLFFDEPPPRHVYTGLKRGGRIKGHPVRVFLAGTPLYQAWLRTEIYEKWTEGRLSDVECFGGSTSDNPHLEQSYITRFGEGLSDEQKLVRFQGHFFDLSGQALAHLWDESKHIIPSNKFIWEKGEWPCVIAMDPHPSKAHVAVLLGIDKDARMYVIAEHARKAVAREFVKDLINLGWFSYRVVDCVYDSLGSGDTTSGEGFKSFGAVVNEVLEEADLGRARPTTFDDKSDEAFIERIRDALAVPTETDSYGLRIPKLRFLEAAKGSIRDIKQVQWTRDKKAGENKPKLDITHKDFLACIKYALAANLYVGKHKARSVHVVKRVYGLEMPQRRRLVRQFRQARQESED